MGEIGKGITAFKKGVDDSKKPEEDLVVERISDMTSEEGRPPAKATAKKAKAATKKAKGKA